MKNIDPKLVSKKLKSLKDEDQFYLSIRSGITYTLQTLVGKTATFTSDSSGRTYIKSWNTPVYLVSDYLSRN